MLEIGAVWPLSVEICCAVFTSHRWIVWSSEAEASKLPFGDHAICAINPVCPRSVCCNVKPGGGGCCSRSRCRCCSSLLCCSNALCCCSESFCRCCSSTCFCC